jgi:predicted dithiol-disulfide oxidoreductase (DUF899 family)
MSNEARDTMEKHRVVSREEWLRERIALLAREKAFDRERDALARERRALPWVKVEKSYAFDGPRGKASLADLFGKRSQLAVYHFMFAPEWDAGCKHCSFWADSFNPLPVHLAHRDVSLVAVSRAPLVKIEAFKKRMGWTFPWFSSHGSEFNYDFGVSFTPEAMKSGKAIYNYTQPERNNADREGMSAFHKNARGEIFHTYSTFARGIDLLNSAYNFLDLMPKGRDEDALEFTQSWVRHHDQYGD